MSQGKRKDQNFAPFARRIAQPCGAAFATFVLAAAMVQSLPALAQSPQPAAAEAQEAYRLQPQDKLLIRVMTWDFRQNSMTGWEGLSGEYTISPEGNLHLPLTGSLSAVGLTQSDLADQLSDLLRRRAGLDDQPQLSVELVSSLPVYVLGAVEQRGAVPFHPGLTARQALALAGGIFRTPQSADIARGIMLSGEATAAADRLRWLKAEQARISSELAALEAGDTAPAPVAGAAPVGDVQSQLQDADRHARQVRLDSYNDLQTVLRERGERLQQQLALRDEQIAATRKELEDITSLNERGLAVNARVTSLSTSLNDLEAKRLELETAQLLLDEQLNQAERDSSTISTDAIADRLLRLSQLQSEISAAEIQERTARAQFTAMMDAATPQDAGTIAETDLTFVVTRGADRNEVSPEARLMPGDTLDILPPSVQANEE
ncbi:hypothetical protein FQV27_16080 [Paracoccus aurantiacus]|uniref:Polysaccharide export protein N-terminal domain-containing protein n=1 Tax=Paracoccus aurantiacus TaxID=2599412 RepID=A0A5C6RWE4_9RHOB|nr:polysaccharide biosynthesis/export family protein [Paracoccus aurantiacus]TXB66427.1 hypothetical protein FQV27_16080 [Paracoccus aurantiacus]